MRVSEEQYKAAYDVAAQVYEDHFSIKDGAALLHGKHGLNETSARDFIYDYRCLRMGKVFHRGMSGEAMSHFITKIASDFGSPARALALSALQAHIDYMEGKFGGTLHTMRAVIARFPADGPLVLSVHQEEFAESVRRSMRDSQRARHARLARSSALPIKVKALTDIFLRNPDVVAEVLERAAGRCEGCQKPAPFIRRSDGSPYLEVHHIKQLADGGEDTVTNAAALCPNCHRQRHFGV